MTFKKRKSVTTQSITIIVAVAFLLELCVPLRPAEAQQAAPTAPVAPAPSPLAPSIPAPSPSIGPGTPGVPAQIAPAPGQGLPGYAPSGQVGTPSAPGPGYPGQAPGVGAPGISVPGMPAPGFPSSLTPIAPPIPGTVGQPVPASPLIGQPAQVPGQAPGALPSGIQVPGQAQPGQIPGQVTPQVPGQVPGQIPTAVPGATPVPGAPPQEAAQTFIEQSFSTLEAVPLTVNRRLRQFGYSLFEAPASTFAPVQDVPVGPDYLIAPGDTLVVSMWGLAEGNFQLVVDRNGEILLPKAGPVRVWGLKFSEMETLVKDQLNQYYTRVNISVTMGPLRTMKVFILGEVVKPGAFTVSSISTITNSLFAAGGPSKQGSLRDIRLIRNNRIIARLDLYKFLLDGDRADDQRLMPDDTIFVPPIGRVVAMAGYVKRPAIFELKEETTLSRLLEMAGGLTALTYVKRVQVERVFERQRKVALDTEFSDMKDFEARTATFPLQEGDFVSVFPIVQTLYSYVALDGNVMRPGTYALKPNMRVKDLIDLGDGVLPGTYMARADLAKFYDGRQYETVPVDLGAVMAGDVKQNFLLNQFDRVIVYHQLDIRPKSLVQITGSVYRPGVFELTPSMRVSDLVFKGQPTRLAYLRKAEVYRADPGTTVKVLPIDLEQILANPGGETDFFLSDRDHVYVREIADGVEKRMVTISGRVRYPGDYAIRLDERLSSLIERAGGYLPGAFPQGAVFLRESIRQVEQRQLNKFIQAQEQSLLAESAATTAGTAELTVGQKADVTSSQAAVTSQRRELLRSLAASVTLGRLSLQIDSSEKLKGTPNDIMLEDGDSLYIPQEPTSVLVVGSVRNSNAILHAEKQNIEYYLDRAGGATRDADVEEIYIVKPDGNALSSFVKLRQIEAGDTIVVPISTEPRIRTLPLMKDIATIVAGFALPFAAIAAFLK